MSWVLPASLPPQGEAGVRTPQPKGSRAWARSVRLFAASLLPVAALRPPPWGCLLEAACGTVLLQACKEWDLCWHQVSDIVRQETGYSLSTTCCSQQGSVGAFLHLCNRHLKPFLLSVTAVPVRSTPRARGSGSRRACPQVESNPWFRALTLLLLGNSCQHSSAMRSPETHLLPRVEAQQPPDYCPRLQGTGGVVLPPVLPLLLVSSAHKLTTSLLSLGASSFASHVTWLTAASAHS